MKVKLPPGILRPLPNAEAANKVPTCAAIYCSPDLNFRTILNIDFETSVSSFGGTGLAQPGQVTKAQCN